MPEADIQLRAVLDASSALKGLDKAIIALLPDRLVADLSGMVARWRTERGLSDEPASAVDLAKMILSLEGIGQVIIDAYLKGAGMLVRHDEPADEMLGIVPRLSFAAVRPERVEVRDAPQEQPQGQAGRQGQAVGPAVSFG